VKPAHTSFLADMVTNMKQTATSKPFFSPEQIKAAIAAAPEHAIYDPENPPTLPSDWDNAIISHSLDELHEKLAERRGRGPNKQPTKKQVAIRLSPDVLEFFQAGGSGWQTRVDEALREYVDMHKAA